MSQLVSGIKDMVAQGRLDAALQTMIDLVGELVRDPGLAGRTPPFPALDQVCGSIGAASDFDLLASSRPAIRDDHDLVIVTETFVQGGHLQVVRDIADWSERPLVLVATNLFNRKVPVMPMLSQHPRVQRTIVLDDAALIGRLRALQALVVNPAARRVLLLCHANDAVAIAAVAAVTDRPVLFFHHCDHTACLGCFLPHALHIDLHNLAVETCRFHLGITPRHICLTSRDTGPGRTAGPYAYPVFKTASCGNEHKLGQLRYPIRYLDVVLRLLKARKGVHYHIGDLSDGFVASVHAALREANLPEDSFVAIKHVTDLRDMLDLLDVDLYIPTLPQAGGKAMIDAMSAGVPILVHENAIDRLWGGRDLVYPEAPSWSTLHELDTCLAGFDDPAYWHDQAKASRAYFHAHHSTAHFASLLRQNGGGAHFAVPALKPYRPDFDERLKARAMTVATEGVR